MLFVQSRKELQVSLFQGLCLLLFIDNAELSLEEIQEATKIGQYHLTTFFLPITMHWEYITPNCMK